MKKTINKGQILHGFTYTKYVEWANSLRQDYWKKTVGNYYIVVAVSVKSWVTNISAMVI